MSLVETLAHVPPGEFVFAAGTGGSPKRIGLKLWWQDSSEALVLRL